MSLYANNILSIPATFFSFCHISIQFLYSFHSTIFSLAFRFHSVLLPFPLNCPYHVGFMVDLCWFLGHILGGVSCVCSVYLVCSFSVLSPSIDCSSHVSFPFSFTDCRFLFYVHSVSISCQFCVCFTHFQTLLFINKKIHLATL